MNKEHAVGQVSVSALPVPNNRRAGGPSLPCARQQAGTEFQSVVNVQ